MELTIDAGVATACKNIIGTAVDTARFSKQEFALLGKVLAWLDQPVADFSFHFSIEQRRNGETLLFAISFDGDTFLADEMHTAYDPNVGSDHLTAFEYRKNHSYTESSGDLYAFESRALELISRYEEGGVSIGVSDEV